MPSEPRASRTSIVASEAIHTAPEAGARTQATDTRRDVEATTTRLTETIVTDPAVSHVTRPDQVTHPDDQGRRSNPTADAEGEATCPLHRRRASSLALRPRAVRRLASKTSLSTKPSAEAPVLGARKAKPYEGIGQPRHRTIGGTWAVPITWVPTDPVLRQEPHLGPLIPPAQS